MAYQGNNQKPRPRPGENESRIKTTAHEAQPKTEEDYQTLVAAHLPVDCPAVFRKSVPCSTCPARVDCDENGKPPKSRIERDVIDRPRH